MICLAFLPAAIYAVGNMWESHLSNGIFKSYKSSVFYGRLASLTFLPLLFFIGDGVRTISWAQFAIIVLMLAIWFVWYAFYFFALRRIDVSVSQVVWVMGSATIPFFASLFFGEHVGAAALAGFFITTIAGGGLCIDFKKIRMTDGFWLMIVSVAGFYVNILIQKHLLLSMDWRTLMFYQETTGFALTALLFMIPAAARRGVVGEYKNFMRNIWGFLGYEGLIFVAIAASLFLLAAIPITIKEGIGNTQPLFGLLTVWLLAKLGAKGAIKEDLGHTAMIKKIVCSAAIVFGCALMTI
jgi:drug/metabolite transporter (DMT)-like permease